MSYRCHIPSPLLCVLSGKNVGEIVHCPFALFDRKKNALNPFRLIFCMAPYLTNSKMLATTKCFHPYLNFLNDENLILHLRFHPSSFSSFKTEYGFPLCRHDSFLFNFCVCISLTPQCSEQVPFPRNFLHVHLWKPVRVMESSPCFTFAESCLRDRVPLIIFL